MELPYTITLEKAQQYKDNAALVANAIQQMQQTEGWQMFLAMIDQRRKEIYARDDYPSLEDFRVDRKALKIVDTIIEEFPQFLTDAEDAVDLIERLTEAENQTPISLLFNEQEQAGREA